MLKGKNICLESSSVNFAEKIHIQKNHVFFYPINQKIKNLLMQWPII